MASPANSSYPAAAERAFRFSMGLVEISALASVLGATSAQALAIGSRSVGGLPWAAMSTFGLIHVIKSCVAAAVADRTREAIGLRNDIVDSVLGLDIPLRQQRPTPISLQSNGAVMGLWVRNRDGSSGTGAGGKRRAVTAAGKDERFTSFAFDRTTSAIISSIAPPKAEGPHTLKLYRLRASTRPRPGNIFGHPVSNITDWVALFLSSGKILEIVTVYKLGAPSLAWVTGVCWFYSLSAAILIQLVYLSLNPAEKQSDTRDFVTGELPSAVGHGGAGMIILNLPPNFRRTFLWRSILFFQSIICVGVLVTVFVILGGMPKDAVYAWVGFQAFWLVCRIAFYQMYPVQPHAHSQGAVVAPEHWDIAEPAIQHRIMKVLCALSVHIANTHPRGHYSYRHDTLDFKDLVDLYTMVEGHLTSELPVRSSTGALPEMKVLAVIGDSTFRATNWLLDILDTMEIYDSTIVFIEFEKRVYAVPAVRALADTYHQARALKNEDPESHNASFDPRGMGNLGEESVRWVYWVPVPGDGKQRMWLEAHGNQILREFRPASVSQMELNRYLERGVLNISWTKEEETWISLQTSRKAAGGLFGLLKDVTV